MPKVSTYNITGAQTGEIELNDSVFGVEVNEAVMRQAVLRQLANSAWAHIPPKLAVRSRWWQKALETKRNRPGPCRQQPQPVVGWWRHHLGSPSALLRTENAA